MTEARPKFPVLVVDDSPVYRKLIEHALEDERYSPLFAKNGHQALEFYAKNGPSIVITDCMMPDFSGQEICERIRVDLQHQYTNIMVLTIISAMDNLVSAFTAS